MNAPPPVRSKLSLSTTTDPSITTTDEDDSDDPPVFKSVAHLRIDPAAEPCATVIKPPLRRMCRARHVVWDASPEANHAAYQVTVTREWHMVETIFIWDIEGDDVMRCDDAMRCHVTRWLMIV